MNDVESPLVSIVVPVFNDPEGIRSCLEQLINQTYQADSYEVIVVDNGSTDRTRDVIEEFDVTLLIEGEIQGSYAARNKGVKESTGDILGFTDADCTPDENWIDAGVSTLEQTGADLAGGRIVFEYSEYKSAAERFDATTNMRNEQSVNEGVAKTANLFVRRDVFDTIGLFPERLLSGGDVQWTGNATEHGFELVYAPEAIVSHPSRSLPELLQKQYRVGKGQIQVWRMDDKPASLILLKGLLQFPLKVARFMHSSEENNVNEIETPPDRDVEQGFSVYVVGGLVMLAMSVGRFTGLFGRY